MLFFREKSKLLVEVAELRNKLNKFESSSNEEFEQKLDAAKEQVEDLTLKLEKQSEELEQKELQLTGKHELCATLQNEVHDLKMQISDHHLEKAELEIKVESVKDTCEQANKLSEQCHQVALEEMKIENEKKCKLLEEKYEKTIKNLKNKIENLTVTDGQRLKLNMDLKRTKFELTTKNTALKEELDVCYERLEQLSKELSEIREEDAVTSGTPNNRDAALLAAKSKIAQLSEMLHVKTTLLNKMENIKNENKRLSFSRMSSTRTSSSSSSGNSSTSLDQTTVEEDLRKDVRKYRDLVHEFEQTQILLSRESQYVRKTSKENMDKLLEKMEEQKKVHISSIRYKDCEISAAKKEAEDSRQQLAKLREENARLEEEKAEKEKLEEESRKACVAMEAMFSASEVMVGKLEAQITQLTQELADIKSKLEETTVAHTDELRALQGGHALFLENIEWEHKIEFEKSSASFREKLVEKDTVHEEELCGIQREKEDLQSQLDDARASAAYNSEFAKLPKLKEELKKSKENCQMLQKEAVAVREARGVEVQEISELRSQLAALQQTVMTKDEEIRALEGEVKQNLRTAVTAADSSTFTAATSTVAVKTEPVEEDSLQEQLKAKDAEISELLQRLSMSQNQSVVSVNTTAAPSMRVSNISSEDQHCHEDIEEEKEEDSDYSPSKTPAASQRNRGKAKSVVVEETETDESSAAYTPAPHKRKGRAKGTTAASHAVQESTASRSVRRVTRATRSTATVSILLVASFL